MSDSHSVQIKNKTNFCKTLDYTSVLYWVNTYVLGYHFGLSVTFFIDRSHHSNILNNYWIYIEILEQNKGIVWHLASLITKVSVLSWSTYFHHNTDQGWKQPTAVGLKKSITNIPHTANTESPDVCG